MEVEAKLEARRRGTLDAIGARRELGGFELRAVAVRDLETIYLDTARRDLLRAKIALRVRRAKDGVELTLKLPGKVAGAIHRRPETTWPLRTMPRMPLVLRRRELRRELERFTAGRAILPLVGTSIRRRAILVVHPGGGTPLAEIDCDEVTFFRPDGLSRSATALAVEVELLGGEEKDLRAIVRSLRARYRLRPSRASKLERALSWAGVHVPGRRR